MNSGLFPRSIGSELSLVEIGEKGSHPQNCGTSPSAGNHFDWNDKKELFTVAVLYRCQR